MEEQFNRGGFKMIKIRNYENLLLFLSRELGRTVKDVEFWDDENEFRIKFEEDLK